MIDPLVGLCARPHPIPEQRDRIRAAAAQRDDWTTLPSQAHAAGIVPLVAYHLDQSEVDVPRPVRLQLVAGRMQERRRWKARESLLAQTLDLADALGVPCRVLKGAAAAGMLYPEPGLRAMTDVDVLVPEEDADRLWRALQDRLGLEAQPGTDGHRHRPGLATMADGTWVLLELHTRLGPWRHGPGIDDLDGEPMPLVIGGRPALGLSPRFGTVCES